MRYRYLMDDKSSDILKLTLQRNGETVYTFEGHFRNSDYKLTEPLETPIAVNNANLSTPVPSLPNWKLMISGTAM